ncbi:MAG: hypothetical protein OSB09_02335 [Planctomycetota bacterium]|nr:hypothetical protein [Planctomycetota bacterium]
MIFNYNPHLFSDPPLIAQLQGALMTFPSRACLSLSLIISLLGTAPLGAQAPAQQAAVSVRAIRMQPGTLPPGAIPLQVGLLPSGVLPVNTFPPLPPNHFVGQDCTQCHDPFFMAMYEASLGSGAPGDVPGLETLMAEPAKTTSIADALNQTTLAKPRNIEAVLEARRDLAFGGLKEMPVEATATAQQNSARAERIAMLIRSGDWSGYQEELIACADQADQVHPRVVQLLSKNDQAMLPEEVLDLATVALPETSVSAMENPLLVPGVIDSSGIEVTSIEGSPIEGSPIEVTLVGDVGTSVEFQAIRSMKPSRVEIPAASDTEDPLLQAYGALLKRAASRGSTRTFLQRLERGAGQYGGPDPESRARACDLLVAAEMYAEAKPFLDPLPPEGPASAQLRIRHGLYHLAISRSKEDLKIKRDHQIQSADLFSSVAEDSTVDAKDRTRSVTLLTQLLPDLPHRWTTTWRQRVFTDSGEVGQALLSQLGSQARAQIQNRASSPDRRLKTLKSIRVAVATLLDQVGEEIGPWQASIDALAIAFSDEANLSLGNPISLPVNRRASQKIRPRDLVDATPDQRWLQAIAPSLRQTCALATIACAARADEPDRAMSALRALAEDPAVDISKLASVLISEWSRNLDPNRPDDDFFERRIVSSSGIFFRPFGGQRSAPLTRSKQRRSLRHLGELVVELREMKVPDLDWTALVAAFTASHSQAEVYLREDIEALFGPVDQLPVTVAEQIAKGMWRQLQRNWRSPELQQSKGTRRTTKELQEEVERGYQLGLLLTTHAREQAPQSWQAPMLAGNLRFDLAEYWHELDPDLERYVPQREAAFARYGDAVRIYSEQFNAGQEPRAVTPHMQWFISALGATELGFLTMTTKPENDQVGLLEGSLAALPEEEQLLHRGLFASAVESSVGQVKADMKSRFVRHAMRVIGDHPLGRGTRRLARLYQDLESEVELSVSIDGKNQVGTDPFGVRVALRYTDSLEREAGGFDLYLRNMVYIPMAPQPMNYRDDFEARLREAFDEHFTIEALQFNSPDSKPYSFQRPGWMEQAFAYLILRAKDRSVDLLPEVRIDLDFRDGTDGSVRVPVVSAILPILATSSSGPRPTAGTNQVEIALDDRELESGKLKLEILANGLGVLPDLDGILPGWKTHIVDAGYSLAEIDGLLDNGLNVVKIDAEAVPIVPESERSWTIHLVTPEMSESSVVFHFPKAAEGTELICKKYDDFDIVTLEQPMATLQLPSRGLPDWVIMTIGGIVAALVIFLLKRNQKVAVVAEPRWKMPEEVSPLSVAHLLRCIDAEQALIDQEQLPALRKEVASIEARYFSEDGEMAIDFPALTESAQQWITRSKA